MNYPLTTFSKLLSAASARPPELQTKPIELVKKVGQVGKVDQHPCFIEVFSGLNLVNFSNLVKFLRFRDLFGSSAISSKRIVEPRLEEKRVSRRH